MSPSVLAGKRIAVVEDEIPLSMVLEIMLGELGCVHVASVQTLAEALSMADDVEADAVLLDYRLKGEGSAPAVERFLARGIKVIMTSGDDTISASGFFRECSVIRKPYGLTHLEQGLVEAFRS